MTIDPDATGAGYRYPARIRTHLHLPASDGVEVEDVNGQLNVLRLGGPDAEVAVFARRACEVREVAEAATVWADLREARERGEDVEQWGAWVLPADTFGGPR
jgi:hypothetical protein